MPYVHPKVRAQLDAGALPGSSGELNYVITRIADGYIRRMYGAVNYEGVNEVVGVLECAKLELYRRVAAPYEDTKRQDNGDVYGGR